jgi:hypothetical protein
MQSLQVCLFDEHTNIFRICVSNNEDVLLFKLFIRLQTVEYPTVKRLRTLQLFATAHNTWPADQVRNDDVWSLTKTNTLVECGMPVDLLPNNWTVLK